MFYLNITKKATLSDRKLRIHRSANKSEEFTFDNGLESLKTQFVERKKILEVHMKWKQQISRHSLYMEITSNIPTH